MNSKVMGFGLAVVLSSLPIPGRAQVSIGASVGIDIRFPEPPPLVVVTPGVQVVPEYDQEVYFVSGYYWVRREDVWYRTSRYDGGWRPVRTVYVPAALVRIPPGQYRHYYRDDDGRWRPHDAAAYRGWRERHPWDERRAWWHEHRNDRMVRTEQERSWREHEQHERMEQRADWKRDKDERKDARREDERDRHEGHHGGGHGRH